MKYQDFLNLKKKTELSKKTILIITVSLFYFFSLDNLNQLIFYLFAYSNN